MPYLDIKNKYLSYKKYDSSIVSNLHACSYDSTNNHFVLNNNYLPCLCFEKIRDLVFPSQNIHACDALFFSDTKKILVFIEFKNRDMGNPESTVIDDVCNQAVDSIFVHKYVVVGIKDANLIEMHFLAVASSEKNSDISLNEAIKIMLAVSGNLAGGSNSSVFNKQIESIINFKLVEKKYDHFGFKYSFIGMLLSNSFNLRFQSYL